MNTDDALEVVFETIAPAEVAIVKSLLESSDIPFLIRGEDEYDAFRGALRGTFYNPRGRPVEFLVPADMADDVRRLLNEAGDPPDTDG